jgi:putative spermidine/putrescine transport system permease protein
VTAPVLRRQHLLWPSAFLCLALLALPQATFIAMSFHEDLGLGQFSDTLSLQNYAELLTDPFYRRSIVLTVELSMATVVCGLLLGFPTAYVLARAGRWVASVTISLILMTSLITIVVKVIGLNIMLSASGLLNHLLLALSVVAAPVSFIGNELGVLIGLINYTLPVLIVMLFSVVQTIPTSLEEAAEIHGAARFAIYRSVVLPLAWPGLLAGSLIVFNMSMGAFTSAVLLGGGRVRTMPVLIQQTIIQNTEFGRGAALATLLLVLVFGVNLAIGLLVAGRSSGRSR